MDHDQIQQLKFDEYKMFIDDTARFTDRRQGISNTYLTVNSIFLSVIVLLMKDAGLQQSLIPFAVLLMVFAGLVICLSWYQQIERYRKLLSLRFNALEEMETKIVGIHKMYHVEREKLYPKQENVKGKKRRSNFSNMEKFLPYVFSGIYVLFGVTLLLAWALDKV
jgi:hypothetical protein